MPQHETREDEAFADNLTREEESHEEIDWMPPSVLEAPEPRPGMAQRWVSTSILGKEVPHHTMKRFREGWKPRALDTVPSDFAVPTITHGQYEGYVGVEGMILCEMPLARVKKRAEYFQGRVSDQNRFVKSSLAKVEKEGGYRISEEESKVSVRKGNRRQGVADD